MKRHMQVASFVLLGAVSLMVAQTEASKPAEPSKVAQTEASKTVARHPFVGTWKMIPDKSRFSAIAACQRETVKIEEDGRVTIDQATSEGKTFNWSYRPVQAGAATARAAKIEGLEKPSTVQTSHTANTLTESFNWNGWHMKGHGVLAKGGKTMTYTLTGTNDKGKPFKDVMVFEKQE